MSNYSHGFLAIWERINLLLAAKARYYFAIGVQIKANYISVKLDRGKALRLAPA